MSPSSEESAAPRDLLAQCEERLSTLIRLVERRLSTQLQALGAPALEDEDLSFPGGMILSENGKDSARTTDVTQEQSVIPEDAVDRHLSEHALAGVEDADDFNGVGVEHARSMSSDKSADAEDVRLRPEFVALFEGGQNAYGRTSTGGGIIRRRTSSNYREGPPVDVVTSKASDKFAIRCAEREVLLSPDSSGRLVFDICSVFTVLYDSTVQPFLLAWDIGGDGVTYLMSVLSLVFWSVDMIMNFITGYHTYDGELEMRYGPVARNYLKGWLLIDITLNSLDWVGMAIGDEASDSVSNPQAQTRALSKAGRIVRIARIFRVFRIFARLQKIMGGIVSHRYTALTQVAQILIIVVWINHLVGCLWMGVARIGADWFDQTWLDRYDGGPSQLTYGEASVVYQYSTAVHWSMSQMTPGSMEVFPANALERLLNIICLIFGLMFGTSLISQLSAMMVQINMSRREELSRMRDLRRYLSENSVNATLARLISRQIQIRLSMETPLIEKNVKALQLLSGTLLLQLQEDVYTDLLKRHVLFNLWTDLEAHTIKDLCRLQVVERMIVNSGDELFSAGQTARHMFLLLQGKMTYHIENFQGYQNFSSKIETGSWICEGALWLDWRHIGTMVSEATSCLLQVNVDKMIEFITKTLGGQIANVEAWAQAYLSVVATDTASLHRIDTGIDHGSVVMAMSPEVRETVGEIMSAQVAEEISTSFMTKAKGQQELSEEVKAGKCVLIREGTGIIVRTVYVVAVRITRPSDQRILIQIAKRDANNQWVASVNYPGTKMKPNDVPKEVASKLIKKELRALAPAISLGGAERKTALKESDSFSIQTRYHRIIFLATFREGQTMEELVENEMNTNVVSSVTGEEAVGRPKTMDRSQSVHNSDLPFQETIELADSKGKKIMYSWMVENEIEEMQNATNAKPLKAWLDALNQGKA